MLLETVPFCHTKSLDYDKLDRNHALEQDLNRWYKKTNTMTNATCRPSVAPQQEKHNRFIGTPPFHLINEGRSYRNPPVNIQVKEDAVIMEVFAPGLNQHDLEVLVENQALIIRHLAENKANETNPFLRKEFNRAGWSMRFRISDKYQTTEASTELKDGVLLIRLPKRADWQRKIEVQ
jgi:HSP20 family protein